MQFCASLYPPLTSRVVPSTDKFHSLEEGVACYLSLPEVKAGKECFPSWGKTPVWLNVSTCFLQKLFKSTSVCAFLSWPPLLCACVCAIRSPRVSELPIHRYVNRLLFPGQSSFYPCAPHIAHYSLAFLLLQAHLWALNRNFWKCMCLGNINSSISQQCFIEAKLQLGRDILFY